MITSKLSTIRIAEVSNFKAAYITKQINLIVRDVSLLKETKINIIIT